MAMATVARRQATTRGGSGREAGVTKYKAPSEERGYGTIDQDTRSTYKRTCAKTRRRISTSEISMVVPYGVYGYCQERHSAIFDLDGCGFEEEGYPVVDYESALQTAKSTTVR
uniref:Uncharacterized protein n=1 Tax=Oryza sativa subsp. japonica TaxID=39947 RepID=Q6Z0M2_ORYSJ|nr:hypothetical protein [Oryza sativa Japonica Group]